MFPWRLLGCCSSLLGKKSAVGLLVPQPARAHFSILDRAAVPGEVKSPPVRVLSGDPSWPRPPMGSLRRGQPWEFAQVGTMLRIESVSRVSVAVRDQIVSGLPAAWSMSRI